MSRTSKYFWPASGITETDMALLYRVRESSAAKVTISELIVRAVRQSYAEASDSHKPVSLVVEERKEAA